MTTNTSEKGLESLICTHLTGSAVARGGAVELSESWPQYIQRYGLMGGEDKGLWEAGLSQ